MFDAAAAESDPLCPAGLTTQQKNLRLRIHANESEGANPGQLAHFSGHFSACFVNANE
jgi:hypothetical protein